MSVTLAELATREDILRTLRRYAQGVDQRDWALYLSAFTSDATVEVPGYLPGRVTAEEFSRHLAGTFDSLRISGQHLLANTVFVITSDEARTVTEFLATNAEREPEGPSGAEDELAVHTQRVSGLYADELVPTDSGWRIRHRILAMKNEDTATITYPARVVAAVAGAARNTVVHGL
ncbi:MAG: nuclear transport factor 2 family protein [Propionibacteriaceae bacterium]|nr:nuclear transport factor 2 family protein [Propionibacteriaceae bacterium]